MKRLLPVGKLPRIRVHYSSWIFALVLISLALVTQFSILYGPLWSRLIFGLCAGLIVLIILFVREVAISLLAANKGIRIKQITLFTFGGIRKIDQQTTTPDKELLLAVTGMLYDLSIALALFLAYTVLSLVGQAVVEVLLQWLAFIFIVLFLFHLLPAYPLDGGRILRTVLWIALKNAQRAASIAYWTGLAIGWLLTLGGLLTLIITIERFSGALLAAFGLILVNAATNSHRQESEMAGELFSSLDHA